MNSEFRGHWRWVSQGTAEVMRSIFPDGAFSKQSAPLGKTGSPDNSHRIENWIYLSQQTHPRIEVYWDRLIRCGLVSILLGSAPRKPWHSLSDTLWQPRTLLFPDMHRSCIWSHVERNMMRLLCKQVLGTTEECLLSFWGRSTVREEGLFYFRIWHKQLL